MVIGVAMIEALSHVMKYRIIASAFMVVWTLDRNVNSVVNSALIHAYRILCTNIVISTHHNTCSNSPKISLIHPVVPITLIMVVINNLVSSTINQIRIVDDVSYTVTYFWDLYTFQCYSQRINNVTIGTNIVISKFLKNFLRIEIKVMNIHNSIQYTIAKNTPNTLNYVNTVVLPI